MHTYADEDAALEPYRRRIKLLGSIGFIALAAVEYKPGESTAEREQRVSAMRDEFYRVLSDYDGEFGVMTGWAPGNTTDTLWFRVADRYMSMPRDRFERLPATVRDRLVAP